MRKFEDVKMRKGGGVVDRNKIDLDYLLAYCAKLKVHFILINWIHRNS
jgi:hypothetical protein